jgi:hypothetical protein
MSVRQRMHNHILQGLLAIIVAGALPWGCIVHCMMHSGHVHQHGADCDMMVTVSNQPTSPDQITSPPYTPSAVHIVINNQFLSIKEFLSIEALLTKKFMLSSITTPPLSPPPQ